MANVTKYGVSYDFSNPDYECRLDGVTFRFTSASHLNRFKEYATQHMRGTTSSLTRRFKHHIDSGLLGLFQYYRQVETRGYYVVVGDVVYRSPDCIKFKLVIDDA